MQLSRAPQNAHPFLVFTAFTAAFLPWATVHPAIGILVGAILVALGVGLWSTHRSLPLDVATLAATGLVLVLVASLVPWPGTLTELMQPDVHNLRAALARSDLGGSSHPLAASPAAAVRGVAWTAALLVFGVGVRSSVGGSTHPKSLFLAFLTVLGGVIAWAWTAKALGIAGSERAFGPFINPNHATTALCAGASGCVALAWGHVQRTERLLLLAGAAVLGIAAVSTGSRGVAILLPTAFGLPTLLLGRRIARLVTIGIGVVGAAVVSLLGAGGLAAFSELVEPGSTYHGLFDGRIQRLSEGLQLLSWSPWTGIGTGGYAVLAPVVKVSPVFARATHLHDDPVQFAIEHGLLGVGLLGVALVAVGVRCAPSVMAPTRGRSARVAWLSVLVVLSLASLWGFPLQIGALSLLWVTSLAVLLGTAPRPQVSVRAERLGLALLLGLTLTCGLASLGWSLASESSPYGPRPNQPADLAACEVLIRAHPFDARLRTRCSQLASSPEDRLAWLEAARRLDPSHPSVAWLEARALEDLGRPEDAYAARLHALSLDLPPSTEPEAWLEEAARSTPPERLLADLVERRPARACEYAQIFVRQGRAEEAHAAWQAGFDRDPTCAAGWAAELLRVGRPREAGPVVELVPDGCGKQLLAAWVALEIGELEAAEATVDALPQRCAHRDTDTQKLRLHLAATRGEAQATGVLAKRVEADGPEPAAERALARGAVRRGENDEAVRRLEALVLFGHPTPEDSELLMTISAP